MTTSTRKVRVSIPSVTAILDTAGVARPRLVTRVGGGPLVVDADQHSRIPGWEDRDAAVRAALDAAGIRYERVEGTSALILHSLT